MEELTTLNNLGRDLTCLHHIAGAEFTEGVSLQLFDENHLIYFSASSVTVENFNTKEKEYLLSRDANGISCVSFHKER